MELLTATAPEGPIPIDRILSLPRNAYLVGTYEQAVEVARVLLESWQGPSSLIVPKDAGSRKPKPHWSRMLDNADLDNVIDFDEAVQASFRQSLHHLDKLPVSVLAGLAFRTEQPRYKPVHNAQVLEAHSWFTSYLTMLGQWPKDPSEHLLERANLRSDLMFSDFLTVQTHAGKFGAKDLWKLLLDDESTSPRSLCGVAAHAEQSRSGFNAVDSFLTDGWPYAEWYGDRVIVLTRRAVLEDFCLAWHVRTRVNGGAFPLILPYTPQTRFHIRFALSSAPREMGRRTVAISSCSISPSEIEKVAMDGNANSRCKAEAVRPEDLVAPTARWGLRTSDLAYFLSGAAQVDSHTMDDKSVVKVDVAARNIPLRSYISPTAARLKSSPRAQEGFVDVIGGRVRLREARTSGKVTLRWPSSWGAIRIIFRTLGYEARPSIPGAAAVNVLRQVGFYPGCSMFANPNLLRLLDHSVRKPSVDALTFEAFKQALGGNSTAASRWLNWATGRGVLLPGLRYACVNCGYKHWRPISEYGQGNRCELCSDMLHGPTDSKSATFYYRASIGLKTALSTNSLTHLLALKYLSSGFQNGRERIVGVHPGIELRQDGESRFEIDGTILLSSGGLAIGEVKNRSVDMTPAVVDQLELLGDKLDVAFTFYATPEFRSTVTAEYDLLARCLPERPRIALTGDELYTQYAGWTINSTPVDMHPSGEDKSDKLWLVDRLRDEYPLSETNVDSVFLET